jgi:hypothetical protein
MPMSGSPEKRRDCIAQLPLRSTSGGSKFASEHKDVRNLELRSGVGSAGVCCVCTLLVCR